jgi:hypothetical protein
VIGHHSKGHDFLTLPIAEVFRQGLTKAAFQKAIFAKVIDRLHKVPDIFEKDDAEQKMMLLMKYIRLGFECAFRCDLIELYVDKVLSVGKDLAWLIRKSVATNLKILLDSKETKLAVLSDWSSFLIVRIPFFDLLNRLLFFSSALRFVSISHRWHPFRLVRSESL